MSNALRRFKRQQDRDSKELPKAEQKLPTGRMHSQPLKGAFLSFPLLGWIALRERDDTPLVMLMLALVTPAFGPIQGTMQMELPLYDDTLMRTVAALERFGWTGTHWSLEDPPPFDNVGLRDQLIALLAQTPLKATLLFAADPETGNVPAQSLEVMRSQGPFLMPPLEAPSEPPNPERVKALNDLVLSHKAIFSAAEGGNVT